jgi:hypothetical protein
MRLVLSDTATLLLLIAVMGALWVAWLIEAEMRKRYGWRPLGLPPGRIESIKKNVNRRAIALTMVCAVLLGGGSCYGFLNTFTMSGAASFWNTVFLWCFLLSVLAFVIALLWAVVKRVRDARERGKP